MTMTTLSFLELCRRNHAREPGWTPPVRLLAFDPGGTTGWARFDDGAPKHCGQKPGNFYEMARLLDRHKPTVVVIEEYVLYPHKAKEQAWSDFPESQLIGALLYMCWLRDIPVYMQGANDKDFCSDDKLKAWGYYQSGLKHSNDAIRHACFYLLFGAKRSNHHKRPRAHSPVPPHGPR